MNMYFFNILSEGTPLTIRIFRDSCSPVKEVHIPLHFA